MPSGRAAMIERMQAMLQAADQAAPRIVTADEAIAEDLQRRHGAQALLIEARTGHDGRLRVFAVLDLDHDALAAEAKRLAERADDAPEVEVIDRTTWLAMRRLAATGMLKLAEGPSRVLHQAPELAAADPDGGDQIGRLAELSRQAERSLRMAKVLAAGGFPEEASPLIARAIGHGAAAKLLALGELPAGISLATPTQLRDLVERGALPSQAAATLAALGPGAGVPSGAELTRLFEAAAHVLAA
jgi:hypothetical protein